MGNTLLASPVEYLIREDGQRTGVVLRWEDYQTLRAQLPFDPDILANLSEPELQTLADGMLSSRHQQRLDELLQRNREGTADDTETRELDRLLEYVDHLNVIKTRASYTLHRLAETKAQYG